MMNDMNHDIYLASGSPRRKELLEQIKVRFALLKSDIDETPLPVESPQAYVQRLAEGKAKAGWHYMVQAGLTVKPVLGADTTVVLDGEILGKPEGKADAIATLKRLGGRTHQVYTAIAFYDGQQVLSELSCTKVEFAPISTRVAEAYWASGEPRDKAGSYAIQGLGASFVRRIEGSYSGVVGLPLAETVVLLQQLGIDILQVQPPFE